LWGAPGAPHPDAAGPGRAVPEEEKKPLTAAEERRAARLARKNKKEEVKGIQYPDDYDEWMDTVRRPSPFKDIKITYSRNEVYEDFVSSQKGTGKKRFVASTKKFGTGGYKSVPFSPNTKSGSPLSKYEGMLTMKNSGSFKLTDALSPGGVLQSRKDAIMGLKSARTIDLGSDTINGEHTANLREAVSNPDPRKMAKDASLNARSLTLTDASYDLIRKVSKQERLHSQRSPNENNTEPQNGIHKSKTQHESTTS
jgi:hypothetical protein